MDLTCLCIFLGVLQQRSQFPEAFPPQHLYLTMQQVFVLALLLADLLKLSISHSLRRYLDDVPPQYGLIWFVLFLIGKI